MPFTKNMDATIAENMCRREFLTWLHVARYGIETRADVSTNPKIPQMNLSLTTCRP